MADGNEQFHDNWGWKRRVDFDDPIVQIIEQMVRELEAQPNWDAWQLASFRDQPMKHYKGGPTTASHMYNAHYNELFAIAVRAFKEGYRMAQEGIPLLLLEAEMIAEEAWPKEEKKRRRGGDDWWWKSRRPWGYT